MQIRVLGAVEVEAEGAILGLGGPRQRALLALLIAEVPNPIPTERLITGIWGEDAAPGTRASLQTYVSNLRQLLGGRVVFDRGAYRLDVDPEEIDANVFDETVVAARSRVATDPQSVSTDLRGVLAGWRGRPYADLTDVPGLEQEVRRLEALRLEAVELRVEADLASGHDADLVAELEALAEEHPTRERFRAQHMLALYRSGRQAEALRAYRRTESYLANELGVDPSPELQDLELRVLEQDDSLSAGGATAVTHRLAFLVTDIEGSTTRWDRFPQAMAVALTNHDTILRDEVGRVGGRVFKHTGDGVLAVLPNAVTAADAAEAIQTRIMRTDWGEVGELKVRIGIDLGEAEERGGDFFGPPLNRAARLCAIAHGGQVLVSSAAEREVTATAPAGLQIRHLGEVSLRGMATPERIAQLVFVGLSADFPELRLDADSGLDGRLDVMTLPGYELRDRIGEGAFGVVWRAYQPSVGREVAIKVIRPELAAEASFVRRFEAEARTIARIAHPHIVPLIDFWRLAESAYLVLALLPGGSLADAVRDAHVDPDTSRRILSQLAAALDHAHSQGVAHGDLKPANVMLDGAGNAYLSDFGIAARLLDPAIVQSVSSAPQYRAPEEGVTGPTPAADRYALGVLAAELIGSVDGIEEVLTRATAVNPEDRYESASALVRHLEVAIGGDVSSLEDVTVSRNPYKGLRAFDEGDAADFYGRDDLVAAVLTSLQRNRFVTVVGPSGSGKSSVVRSGVVPRLASGEVEGLEQSLVITFTPGATPVDALMRALAPGTDSQGVSGGLAGLVEHLARDGEPLLVVDQFEEVYTHVDDPEIRRHFIDLLVEVIENGGRVLVTLRADYYDRPIGDERIARLIRDGQVTVLPPTRDELVEMITAPARAVGLRWEPGLPHRIVEDVAHQPGGLPLLQYALTELVERRGGDLLTASDYQRIGEVTGALANRAEAVFSDLNAAQQSAARQTMLRLVTVDEESDDTRRRVRRGELESLGISPGDLDHVLDLFMSERLLLGDRDPVSRTPTVEVSHEALLREWPRLRGWIDDQRESLILGRRFRSAMGEWEANARDDDDYLLGGSRLASFVGWAETSPLTPDERDFYDASRARDEEERSARRRRRRALTAVLAGFAVVGITLGAIAAVQAGRATREADIARQAEVRAEVEAERAELSASVARSRELLASAEAALATDPSLAKLLAVSSTRFADPTADTASILHRTFAADRVLSRYLWPSSNLHSADLHPDGRLIVVTGVDPGRLEVFDMDDGELVWAWESEGGTFIEDAYFTVDGSHVLAGIIADDDAVGDIGIHMWEAATGELVRIYDLGECGRDVVAVADGRAFTAQPSGDCDGDAATIGMLDLDSGEWTELVPRAFDGAASGDGRFVAYSDAETSFVVEVATGAVVLQFARTNHPGLGDGAVQLLNHDGSFLVAGARPFAVWEVAGGEIVAEFHGHPGEARAWAFSEDGETVYSSGREDTVKAWSRANGQEVDSFPAVGSARVAVAGDRLLVSDWATNQVRLLDTAPRGEIWAVDTCDGFVVSGGLTRVGNQIAVAELCGKGEASTFLIDAVTRDVREWAGFYGQHQSISPDGTRLVRQEQVAAPVVTADGVTLTVGPLTIRDLATAEVLVELEGLCVFESGIDFSVGGEAQCEEYPATPFAMLPLHTGWTLDANHIVNVRPGVTVWDATTGELVSIMDVDTLEKCPPTHPLAVPDGGRLLFGCFADDLVLEVSTDTWEHSLIDVEGWRSGALVAFTPDGGQVVAIQDFLSFGAASLVWLDAGTFEIEATVEEITRGAAKSYALSPDGRLLAIGTSEGFVHIWDVVERRPVQEIFVADTQMQGVAFLNDTHLAVAPQPGGVVVYTLDPVELAGIVAGSLHRGFTPVECDRYGFGTDCPTLQELRGG